MVDKKEIFGFFTLSAILLGIMFIVPFTIGLSQGGFNSGETIGNVSILDTFQFYMVSGAIGWIIILACYIAQIILTKDDKTYGDSVAFVSLGQKPGLPLFKRFTMLQLIHLSLIFFSIIFLFANITNTQSFTGLKVLPQQFSATDSLLFSSAQVPIAENLVAGAVLAIILLILGIVARKYDIGYTNFAILAFMSVLIMGVFGVAWHSSVYPDSQVAMIVVFFFWTMGSLLTLLTGFFGIFWIMHLMNNFFIDISRFLSSQLLIIYIGFIIATLIGAYLYIYRGRYFGK
jgi:hypothetical protein